VTPAELQAALDAATATLASGQCDEYSARYARDVLALVACVSALRDVLATVERERDEARASVNALLLIVGQARAYFDAYEVKREHGQTTLSKRDEAWIERNEDLDDDVRQCLAGIRVAVRNEREKCEEAMR